MGPDEYLWFRVKLSLAQSGILFQVYCWIVNINHYHVLMVFVLFHFIVFFLNKLNNKLHSIFMSKTSPFFIIINYIPYWNYNPPCWSVYNYGHSLIDHNITTKGFPNTLSLLQKPFCMFNFIERFLEWTHLYYFNAFFELRNTNSRILGQNRNGWRRGLMNGNRFRRKFDKSKICFLK